MGVIRQLWIKSRNKFGANNAVFAFEKTLKVLNFNTKSKKNTVIKL